MARTDDYKLGFSAPGLPSPPKPAECVHYLPPRTFPSRSIAEVETDALERATGRYSTRDVCPEAPLSRPGGIAKKLEDHNFHSTCGRLSARTERVSTLAYGEQNDFRVALIEARSRQYLFRLVCLKSTAQRRCRLH